MSDTLITILTSSTATALLGISFKFWLDKKLANIENRHNRDNDRLKTKLESLKDRHQVDHNLLIDSLKELWETFFNYGMYLNEIQKKGFVTPKDVIYKQIDILLLVEKNSIFLPDGIYNEIMSLLDKNEDGLNRLIDETSKFINIKGVDFLQSEDIQLNQEGYSIINESIAILFDIKHKLRESIRNQLNIYLNFEIEKISKDSKKDIGKAM